MRKGQEDAETQFGRIEDHVAVEIQVHRANCTSIVRLHWTMKKRHIHSHTAEPNWEFGVRARGPTTQLRHWTDEWEVRLPWTVNCGRNGEKNESGIWKEWCIVLVASRCFNVYGMAYAQLALIDCNRQHFLSISDSDVLHWNENDDNGNNIV